VVLQACVLGGLPMIDGGEADDKIIAVLRGDLVYGGLSDLAEAPSTLVDRLAHYFSTYKRPPTGDHTVSVGEPYGRGHAEAVVAAAMNDYRERFGPADDEP
jgi:inorganic pyrophosphatase